MRILRKPSDKQLWFAFSMVIFGCGLLVAGFCVSPTGEIHNSVLLAFGETLTFAGALLGIDYTYRKRFLDRSPYEEEPRNPETHEKE